MNEIFKIVKERRSIRKYKKDKPPLYLILKILETAIWAPSAGNLQDWEIILVTDEKIKEKLYIASYFQNWVKEAAYVIVVCSNLERIKYYGERGITLYSLLDCGALIQNILLLAYSVGLGTCWIGAFDEEKVREILDLPKYVRPVSIICIGYPAESPSSWRYPLEKVLHFNKWGKKFEKE